MPKITLNTPLLTSEERAVRLIKMDVIIEPTPEEKAEAEKFFAEIKHYQMWLDKAFQIELRKYGVIRRHPIVTPPLQHVEPYKGSVRVVHAKRARKLRKRGVILVHVRPWIRPKQYAWFVR